jgi:hypothetical protein
MKRVSMLVVLMAAITFGMGTVAGADDAMSKKEAKPDLKERLTNDAIKGTLMRTEGDYYWIKDDDGNETKVHVDMSTKMDKVVAGDRVKAYITEKRHVTTLQRLEK